jgi:hypothetical protein
MSKWEKLDKSMGSYGWPINLDHSLKTISTIFLMLEAGNRRLYH